MKWFRFVILSHLISAMTATTVMAESELNLAKTIQNPLGVNLEARHFTLPFVNYINYDYGANQQTQNILDMKPVIPFRFTPQYDLFLRTIIPLTHQPSTNGYINGLGDINPVIFLGPAKNNWFIWGIGPSVIMPTATHQELGAGKWSIGPELALIAMPDKWTFAILTSNVWSVAGQSSRPNVNLFSFQYYITYNFPHGWYVTTQPSLTANWMAVKSQQWTVPFGLGLGRAFRIKNQGLNLSLQAYNNVIHPKTGNRYTLQATFEFLFPDKQMT